VNGITKAAGNAEDFLVVDMTRLILHQFLIAGCDDCSVRYFGGVYARLFARFLEFVLEFSADNCEC